MSGEDRDSQPRSGHQEEPTAPYIWDGGGSSRGTGPDSTTRDCGRIKREVCSFRTARTSSSTSFNCSSRPRSSRPRTWTSSRSTSTSCWTSSDSVPDTAIRGGTCGGWTSYTRGRTHDLDAGDPTNVPRDLYPTPPTQCRGRGTESGTRGGYWCRVSTVWTETGSDMGSVETLV